MLAEYQNLGLEKWLVRCVGEILKNMRELRRTMLITEEKAPERFYERELEMGRCGMLKEKTMIMNRSGEGIVKRERSVRGREREG